MAEMVCGRNVLWPNRNVDEMSRKLNFYWCFITFRNFFTAISSLYIYIIYILNLRNNYGNYFDSNRTITEHFQIEAALRSSSVFSCSVN